MSLKTLVRVLLVLTTVSLAVCLLELKADFTDAEWTRFQDFTTRYSRTYRDESERMYRFKVFQESLARQRKLNEYESTHGGSAVYGVNRFSDLSQDEFISRYLSGVNHSPMDSCGIRDDSDQLSFRFEDLPSSFDWREKGVIGNIRDQKRCGSCWAFAVVETIESAYAIETRSKLSHTLSSQQLISCDYNPAKGLYGCSGGYLCEAFLTVEEQNMTLVEENVYPFISENGETYSCNIADLPNKGLRLSQHYFYRKLDELVMKTKLVSYSPLTTSINAISWQDYTGGIIQHHCTSTSFDHAVQVVGYNMTGDVPHWIVRNTWGTDWGENGYIRIKYGENMCGITNEVAVVTKVTGVNI